MFDENILLFIFITLLGFAVTFLGTRNKSEYKRYIITAGIAVAHVGLFGILYDKLSLVPFITLVLFVLSMFVLIDPLKVSGFFPGKLCRILGLILLFASFAFFLMLATGFRVWLWVFPFTLYAVPYTIPSWRTKRVYFQLVAWMLTFCFVGLIGYKVYTAYFPEAKVSSLDQIFYILSPQGLVEQAPFPVLEKSNTPDFELIHNPVVVVSEPDVKSVPAPVLQAQTSQTQTNQNLSDPSVMQNGPIVESLKEFDQKYLELKHDYSKLQEKYRDALHEIEILKSENERLKNR